ncbi:MAG: hypothetical protein ACKERG_02385 [Candidatus Hodgkinia cicadicola]
MNKMNMFEADSMLRASYFKSHCSFQLFWTQTEESKLECACCVVKLMVWSNMLTPLRHKERKPHRNSLCRSSLAVRKQVV